MKRLAFTLTELLVVIATIALLMAILLPTLRRSREGVRAAVCGSNISHLLKGVLIYETENNILPYSLDNRPPNPPQGGYPGFFQYDRIGWWWFNFIEGFYKDSDRRTNVVRCPSKQLSKPSLRNNILCGNYGINRSICKSFDDRQSYREEFVGTPLRSCNITHPSDALLLVDSGYAIISWWHATDEPPVVLGNTFIEDASYVPGLWINKDRNLWPGQEKDAINGRHPNKTVNVGFVDGHVSRTKADDLFVEKAGNDYINKIPLWIPK